MIVVDPNFPYYITSKYGGINNKTISSVLDRHNKSGDKRANHKQLY